MGLKCKENIDYSKRFDSSDNAALYIMKICNPLSISDNLEYGGLIFKEKGQNGKYGFTGPLIGDEDGVNPFLGDVPIPDNTEEVGYWHTHGDYSAFDENDNIVRTSDPSLDHFNSDNFSVDDIQVANNRGASSPEYKGYVATPGNIHRGYDAKKSKSYILEKPKYEED